MVDRAATLPTSKSAQAALLITAHTLLEGVAARKVVERLYAKRVGWESYPAEFLEAIVLEVVHELRVTTDLLMPVSTEPT
jgi:hypothetical protein